MKRYSGDLSPRCVIRNRTRRAGKRNVMQTSCHLLVQLLSNLGMRSLNTIARELLSESVTLRSSLHSYLDFALD